MCMLCLCGGRCVVWFVLVRLCLRLMWIVLLLCVMIVLGNRFVLLMNCDMKWFFGCLYVWYGVLVCVMWLVFIMIMWLLIDSVLD